MYRFQFLRDSPRYLHVDSVVLLSHESFTGNLEQDSAIGQLCRI